MVLQKEVSNEQKVIHSGFGPMPDLLQEDDPADISHGCLFDG
jgi:hypothetical protein